MLSYLHLGLLFVLGYPTNQHHLIINSIFTSLNIGQRLTYGCCNVTWTCDKANFHLCVCGRSDNLLPAIKRQFLLYCGVQFPVRFNNMIFTRFLKEITWKPKGVSTSGNIASNIAGNCVAEPSTLSKFPAGRSKICGKYRHPYLAITLAMLTFVKYHDISHEIMDVYLKYYNTRV